MSMHLAKGLSTSSTKKHKIKMTKKKELDLALYNLQRKKAGLPKLTTMAAPKYDMSKTAKEYKPNRNLENARPGALDYQKCTSIPDTVAMAPVTSIMDPRSLAKETEGVRNAILDKSRRIAPAYNKGAHQYITNDTDPTTIGRK